MFYALHGWTIQDFPILVMGSVSLIQNTVLSIMYFCYKEKIDNEN